MSKTYGIPYKHINPNFPSPLRVIEESYITTLLYATNDDAFIAKAVYWPNNQDVDLVENTLICYFDVGDDRSASGSAAT
jgi:hypothetical protein